MSTTAPARPQTSAPTRRDPVAVAARWLAAHGLQLLQISLGVVFLAFGVLKFFPGASPAEPLVMRTIDTLTLGLVSGQAAVTMTAVIETFIGLTLVTGKFLRTGLVVLAGALAGMMAPLVLFFGDMFPGGTPTLEAQYIFKDIVFGAIVLVLGAKALGARLESRL